MRHERMRTFFISWILSAVIGVSSMLCLITAFDLSMARFDRILLICAAVSAAESFLFSRRNGPLLVLLLLAAASGFLWYGEHFSRQVTMLVIRVANLWDDAYHWGGYVVPDYPPYVDYPIAALTILLITLVARSVSDRKPPLAPIFLGLLCLLLCMAAPDTVPETAPLLMLLAGLALLVITGSTRQESTAQGNRLMLAAVLPVLALTGLLLLVVPQKGYTDRSEVLRNQIITQLQRVPGLLPEGSDLRPSAPQPPARQKMDLSALNGQSDHAIPVMQVRTDYTETLYLRGQDFDVYTRTGWESSPDRQEEFNGWGGPTEEITIRTFRPHEVLYLPYFPDGSIQISQGTLQNTQNLLQYAVTRCPMGSTAGPDILARYLALPDSTTARLSAYLPTEKLSTRETAAQIASIVRNTAPYDRKTGKMPDSESDFVLWFLNRAESGYCVHFASTSVALLRAAGIPARYVTGYKVDAVAGEEVTVTSLDAHAWAEYYDEQLGSWQVLESTPAGHTDTTPETTAPAQTEISTRPAESTAPTVLQPEAPEKGPNRDALWSLFLVPAFLLLAVAQRYFRLILRRKLQQKGAPNRRALRLWQETERLAGLLRESPPESLNALAEKALYSQHTLTDEELALFRDYRTGSLRRLRKRPWYLRLIYQYIYAVY